MIVVEYYNLIYLLFVLPEFLDSEYVEFVSVDVRQQTVGLSDRLSLRCASAVSHQIRTVTCTQDTDSLLVCKSQSDSLVQRSADRLSITSQCNNTITKCEGLNGKEMT